MIFTWDCKRKKRVKFNIGDARRKTLEEYEGTYAFERVLSPSTEGRTRMVGEQLDNWTVKFKGSDLTDITNEDGTAKATVPTKGKTGAGERFFNAKSW